MDNNYVDKDVIIDYLSKLVDKLNVIETKLDGINSNGVNNINASAKIDDFDAEKFYTELNENMRKWGDNLNE